MTDVPPNGEPDGEDAHGAATGQPAYPDPPPPGPPPAFDDDALAAALEADMAPYTQPVAVVLPAVQSPDPRVEPEPEYLPPDVPEYVAPPAPSTPPAASEPEPTTLDAIGRLEEQLRLRELGLPPAEPPPSAEPPSPPPLVEPKIYDLTPQEPEPTAPPTQRARLEDVQGLPPPIGMTAAPIPPYDPNAPIAPLDPFAVPPVSPAEFAGTYGTAVQSPNVPPRPVEDGDDAVDEIDRVFGAPTQLEPPPGNEEASAPPSQPIATRRLRDGDAAMVGEKPENHPVFVIETAGVEATALDLRAARAGRLFWLWFATNSSIISMALGAVLFTAGMSLRQAIVATLTGVALSFLPLGLGTLAGKWSGQPTMVVSRATFGHLGNIAPALIAVLVRVFWGGALLWLLSISSANLLVFAGLDAGLGEAVWTYLFLGVGFVIATVIAVFGYGFVARLQLISSILSGLLIVGVIVLTYPRLNISAALSTGDGPWILVVGGAVIVFSFVGLAWVQSSSDLARYQRPTSSGAATMLSASLGATLPPFILITWGAMLAASDPGLAAGLSESPLTTIAQLLPLWYPAPLLAAAGLGLLSGVILTIYSGGFALQAIGLRMPRFAAVIIAALLVAVAAAVLVLLAADANVIVRDLATTLAVPVAAWAGIFAAEMMIRTRQFDNAGLLAPGGVYPRVRVANLVAFLLITAIGLGLSSATFPGLTWQGFLWPLIGVEPAGALATSDVGVLVALVLGIIVPLATAIPAIRRQEMDSLKATPTGSIPRITGSVPRVTGSTPRVTGSVPRVVGSVPPTPVNSPPPPVGPPPSTPGQAPAPADPLLEWGRDPDPR